LQDVSKVPEFSQLWSDMLERPETLHKSFEGRIFTVQVLCRSDKLIYFIRSGRHLEYSNTTGTLKISLNATDGVITAVDI
jgi:hypothetical protein